jgi:hypothetical protein
MHLLMSLFRQQPNAVDRDTYELVKSLEISPATHPNLFGWWSLTRRFTDVVRGAWGAAAKPVEKKAAAPKKEETAAATTTAAADDDVDLFGDEEETEVRIITYSIVEQNVDIYHLCYRKIRPISLHKRKK